LLAVIGEADPSIVTIEESDPQFQFKIVDLLADGGLSHVKDTRSATDAAALCNRGEVT
jgi:hypothetical protein